MAYKDLTELEKIPLRIEMAEKIAKEELANGVDLRPILESLVKEESYCGAEGIRRVLTDKENSINNHIN